MVSANCGKSARGMPKIIAIRSTPKDQASSELESPTRKPSAMCATFARRGASSGGGSEGSRSTAHSAAIRPQASIR